MTNQAATKQSQEVDSASAEDSAIKKAREQMEKEREKLRELKRKIAISKRAIKRSDDTKKMLKTKIAEVKKSKKRVAQKLKEQANKFKEELAALKAEAEKEKLFEKADKITKEVEILKDELNDARIEARQVVGITAPGTRTSSTSYGRTVFIKAMQRHGWAIQHAKDGAVIGANKNDVYLTFPSDKWTMRIGKHGEVKVFSYGGGSTARANAAAKNNDSTEK